MTDEFNDGRPWKAKHDNAQNFGGDPVPVEKATDATLRDYFAAAAIPTATKWEEEGSTSAEPTYKGIAARAYLLADAMLAARKAGA